MYSEPAVVTRAEQPYAAMTALVTMENIGTVLPELHPQVFAWLDEHGITPQGAPFWKYNVIDMEHEMEVEVAVPIRAAVHGDDRVKIDAVPAGQYATLTYIGHPAGLVEATGVLLDWAARQGLVWDMVEAGPAQRWRARLEIYKTDPGEEPDMDKWETQLAFRLAG